MIEVFIKDGCPYCRKQVEELDSRGTAYRVYNISKDPAAFKKVKGEFGAVKVPVLVQDGKVKSIGFEGKG